MASAARTLVRSRHLLPQCTTPLSSPSPARQPWRIRGNCCRPVPAWLPPQPSLVHRRLFSAEAVAHPTNRVQIYVSRSHNPYLNLSFEHYLLQKSHPDSVVLLLYTNRPCVVIGRNQNPWLEVGLGALNRPELLAPVSRVDGEGGSGNGSGADADTLGVQLVRRRSGGGTVFHDLGNVNYSVLCPPAAFDRDRHALMVVRALQSLGVSSARVNERHDIVLADPDDAARQQTFKVSGSAYKLTRRRSLHHGTCLLSTPNLDRVGQFLRSPAEPYMKARGVDSVRSRIRNVGVGNAAFEEAVVAEFGAMYGNVDVETITTRDIEEIPEVMRGYEELKSLDWIYTQTPQFTFSTRSTEDDPRPRPPLPDYLPKDFDLSITARHGQITEAKGAGVEASALDSVYLHKVDDWRTLIGEAAGCWLNGIFGARPK
ncbi:lipoate ligase A [Apiospora marii]|uniref:Putative lipoate-protein ligase A n=1 Tax=Apiospora marii TaxID=335849 RepID=A0ABR1R355_9PEZI